MPSSSKLTQVQRAEIGNARLFKIICGNEEAAYCDTLEHARRVALRFNMRAKHGQRAVILACVGASNYPVG